MRWRAAARWPASAARCSASAPTWPPAQRAEPTGDEARVERVAGAGRVIGRDWRRRDVELQRRLAPPWPRRRATPAPLRAALDHGDAARVRAAARARSRPRSAWASAAVAKRTSGPSRATSSRAARRPCASSGTIEARSTDSATAPRGARPARRPRPARGPERLDEERVDRQMERSMPANHSGLRSPGSIAWPRAGPRRTSAPRSAPTRTPIRPVRCPAMRTACTLTASRRSWATSERPAPHRGRSRTRATSASRGGRASARRSPRSRPARISTRPGRRSRSRSVPRRGARRRARGRPGRARVAARRRTGVGGCMEADRTAPGMVAMLALQWRSRPPADRAARSTTRRSMTSPDLDQLAITTIRTLAIDGVQKANSGHPGAPMGAAPMAYVLWTRLLRHAPREPDWPDRDRFVLSAGHARCSCTRCCT